MTFLLLLLRSVPKYLGTLDLPIADIIKNLPKALAIMVFYIVNIKNFTKAPWHHGLLSIANIMNKSIRRNGLLHC